MLKYNPDTHWSNALYRQLNILQLPNGDRTVVLNRDDAAGFRLDTLTVDAFAGKYDNFLKLVKCPQLVHQTLV